MKIVGKGLQVGDIGYPLVIRFHDLDGTPKDLGTPTEILFFIKAPDETVLEVEGELLDDGEDGAVVYDTESGDISQTGKYQVQAKVTGTGFTLYSDVKFIYAHPNLEE